MKKMIYLMIFCLFFSSCCYKDDRSLDFQPTFFNSNLKREEMFIHSPAGYFANFAIIPAAIVDTSVYAIKEMPPALFPIALLIIPFVSLMVPFVPVYGITIYPFIAKL